MFIRRMIKHSKIGRVKSQNGFTLVEIVIAIALISIILVGVLMGIATSFKASGTTDKISTGLALAQSQIEYIQTQEYSPAVNGNASYLRIDDALRDTEAQSLGAYIMKSINYDLSYNEGPNITAVSINGSTGDPTNVDTGIQKITLEVFRPGDDNPVTLVTYKVNPED